VRIKAAAYIKARERGIINRIRVEIKRLIIFEAQFKFFQYKLQKGFLPKS
jgi:hypothetical protein